MFDPVVNQPIHELSLTLLEALDTSMSPPWNGMSHNYDPITWDEVMQSEPVAEPLEGEDDWSMCQLNERADHCGRIRWLIENGWNDPIAIRLTNYIWPIEDGNHRLAAAFLMDKKTIKATVVGENEAEVAKVLSGQRKLQSMV